jgi:hypothetical protein
VRATTRVPALQCSALVTAVMTVSIAFSLLQKPALPPRNKSHVRVKLTTLAERNAQAGATCTALGSAAKRAVSSASARWRVASSVIAEHAARSRRRGARNMQRRRSVVTQPARWAVRMMTSRGSG